MKIRWYGGTCLTIKSKNCRIILGEPEQLNFEKIAIKESDLVILPYSRSSYSEKLNTSFDKKNAFVIDGAGEYSYAGVTIQVQSVKRTDGTRVNILSLSTEGVVIASLMELDRDLTGKELDMVSNTDVLVIPVGGDTVLDHKLAVKMVNQIEPRGIIPIQFQAGADTTKEPVESFLKEYGSSVDAQEEIAIKKSDLPVDRTDLYLLGLSVK